MTVPPGSTDLGKCHRCRKTIRYTTTTAGTTLPVEVDPVLNGRVVAWYDPESGRYIDAWFAPPEVLNSRFLAGERFQPHSDMCSLWRKR